MRQSVFSDVLTPEQLEQPLGLIADYMGMERFIELIDMLGGTNVYFPKKETLLRPLLVDKVTSEYKCGTSCNVLARKYGLCERTIRKIVRGK